jgi:hypothetical protein
MPASSVAAGPGCMAERLKTKLLESDKMVDLVAGPGTVQYRTAPHRTARRACQGLCMIAWVLTPRWRHLPAACRRVPGPPAADGPRGARTAGRYVYVYIYIYTAHDHDHADMHAASFLLS